MAQATVTLGWSVVNTLGIATSGLPPMEVGQAVNLQCQVTSGTGVAPFVWSATNLPAGVSIDPNSGVISGTPTTAATGSATIKVVDALG